MRSLVTTSLLAAACAPAASSPSQSRPTDVSLGAPGDSAVPSPPPPKPPSTIARPILAAPKTALIPDPDCFGRDAGRLLGYRPLPDAELEVKLKVVGGEGVCDAATHARAELSLGREESLEQVATCGAWRFTPCSSAPLHAVAPSPPFREVVQFSQEPNWQDMDAQSDGLGTPRRSSYTVRVPGSALSLVHTRAGYVVLYAGEKRVDAFWATAFVTLDGIPHLVTPQGLVRLDDPPSPAPLPYLFIGDRAPAPRGHPWERQN